MPTFKRLLLSALALTVLAICPSAAAAAPPAPPSHPFLFTLEGFVQGLKFVPPPEGEYEDACGVARDGEGDIYIADYYHRLIYVYGPGQEYLTQFAVPGPDGPCNLAVGGGGDVYVNNWRRDVVRFSPSQYPPTEATTYGSETTIDFPTSPGARSTGIALDPATGALYVDDRTYVSVYEPAALAEAQPQPSRTFGAGTLGQGYGVAVSDFPGTAGDVYVPDATTSTVRVFDPSGAPIEEIDGAGTPQHGFAGLVDSSVAIDPTDGHLFVADDTEPGFEHPALVVDEFNAAGEYRGQLPHKLIDAEPSQLLSDGAGNIYVTSGNDEKAQLYGFGPTLPAHRLQVARTGGGSGTLTTEPAGIDCPGACAAEFAAGSEVVLTAVPDPGSAFAGWSEGGCAGTGPCHLTIGADLEVSAEFEPAPAAPLAIAAPAAAAVAAGGGLAPAASTASSPPAPHRTLRRHRPRHRKKHTSQSKGKAG